jgi:hypothetical protein
MLELAAGGDLFDKIGTVLFFFTRCVESDLWLV